MSLFPRKRQIKAIRRRDFCSVYGLLKCCDIDGNEHRKEIYEAVSGDGRTENMRGYIQKLRQCRDE